MKVSLIGSGNMASAFAGQLAKAGDEVIVPAGPDRVTALLESTK